MNIILAIIILGFLVAIHEVGHFVVAKISGMYVTTFSIGMGPKIAPFQKGETEYVISAIPAGGFVSVKGITGDPEIDDDPDDPRLFQNRPILHRMLFTVAGPFMNFLTALVALLIFYLALGVNVVDNDSRRSSPRSAQILRQKRPGSLSATRSSRSTARRCRPGRMSTALWRPTRAARWTFSTAATARPLKRR